MATENGWIGTAARGATAGVAATWAMGKTTTFLYDREDPEAKEREERARGQATAFERAAENLAGLLGRALTTAERKKLGSALHWGLGVGGGVLYALMRRRRWKGVDWGQGVAFGTGFFLVVDEILNTVLGFTPPPQAFPWQAHARGLAGHLVYGVAADTALDVMPGR